MGRYVINCKVYIEGDNDPEEIAQEFDMGFAAAVAGFPHGDVVAAEMTTIEVATGEDAEPFE